MKYLFINSVAGFGSTGRIAAGQCRGLMAQGHECVLAFGREEANCSDIPTVRIGTPMDYRLHGAESRLLDDSGFGSRRANPAVSGLGQGIRPGRDLAAQRSRLLHSLRRAVYLPARLRKAHFLDASRLLELYGALRLF